MTPEERVRALFEEDDRWLERAFDKLQKSKPKFVKDDKISRPKPKIQRLPHYMRGRVEFEAFYTPKLITICPIPHPTNVGLRYEHKLTWTLMYLNETNVTVYDLFVRILDRIEDLRQLISDDAYKVGVRLMWFLLVDGCSVLQVLDKSKHPGGEQALGVSVDQLVRIHQDLLLLENQIPYLVLKALRGDDEAKLHEYMHSFLEIHGIPIPSTTVKLDPGREVSPEHKVTVQDDDPVHLLDYLRRAILKNSADVDQVLHIHNKDKDKHKHKRNSLHLRKYRIGSIRELRAVGIRVKKHPSNTSFHPNFVAGQLLLPELTVDGSTALMFLNLIAYEMCPDFCNDFEISSFIVFLSSLIEQPEDVKELRSAGILRNELASDKEVADLFNKMDVILVPETARYAHIRDQIEDYIQSKRGKIKMLGWMGEAYHTYFRSPWTVIALLAAAFGLALTFIQTWFAIHPKGS